MTVPSPLPSLPVSHRVSLILFLSLTSIIGCSGSEESDGDKPSAETRESRPVARSRIIGEPVEAAILDGIATIQSGVDSNSREELVAFESDQMLLAIKVDVGDDDQTLIPSDYTVTVDGADAKPVGIAFGDSTAVFFDPDEFLSANVELTHGRQGKLGMADDRLAAIELPVPQVVFLFKVKFGDSIDFWHGQTDHRLDVADEADWLLAEIPGSIGDLPGTTTDPVDEKVTVEVVEGQLVRAELNGEEAELYDLKLKVTCPAEGFNLDTRKLYVQGGEKRTRRFFFEFDDREMRMLAGTSYADTTYESTDVRTIQSGGIRMGLHGGTIPLHVIFPDPPFESGLTLYLGDADPVELIPEDEALGEIRPAFLDATVRVARSKIFGKAVKVAVLDDQVPVLVSGKRGDIKPRKAPSGEKFLALRFEVPEGEHKFIANDYRVAVSDADEVVPAFIAVGKLPAESVEDDAFETWTIQRDEEDRAEIRKGAVYAWHSSIPEVILVYKVPEDVTKFTFKHGETQLTLQPSSVAKSWAAIRPEGSSDDPAE